MLLIGLAGLVSHHPGRAPLRPVAELEARVLAHPQIQAARRLYPLEQSQTGR